MVKWCYEKMGKLCHGEIVLWQNSEMVKFCKY